MKKNKRKNKLCLHLLKSLASRLRLQVKLAHESLSSEVYLKPLDIELLSSDLGELERQLLLLRRRVRYRLLIQMNRYRVLASVLKSYQSLSRELPQFQTGLLYAADYKAKAGQLVEQLP